LHWVSAVQLARHAAVPPQYVSPHSLPGSVPDVNWVRVPSWLLPADTEQAWQVELQAAPQQTPSAQKPVTHWLAVLQAAPCPFFVVQVPPLQ